MKTVKVKLYTLDELSEEAKETAIEKLGDINVDYNWWQILYTDFIERLNKIGIDCKTFYFDIGRSDYIFMEEAYVVDERRVLKAAGVDLRTREAREAIQDGLTIQTRHLGGGEAYNYFEPNNFPDVNICEWLRDLLKDFLSKLRDQCEWLTEREQIEETIKMNGIFFLEDGTLPNF